VQAAHVSLTNIKHISCSKTINFKSLIMIKQRINVIIYRLKYHNNTLTISLC